MLGALALASLASACTDRPLSSSDDELGDGDSTDTASEGTSESGSTTTDGTATDDTTTDDTTTDNTTTDGSTTDGSTTDDTTTGQPCGMPEVVYDLTIDANTPPEDLACLRQVNNRLRIEGVDWADLSYLPALEKVGRLEILYDNDSLTSLTGTSLVEIGTLYLSGAALVSTAGLEQLVKLERLYVSGLPEGVTIDLPIGLPTVGIEAYGTNLDPLANLQPQPSGPVFNVTVGYAEDIGGLLSCCAIPELNLDLWDTALTDFTDLQGITTMHGLHVYGAAQLVSLAGLEQLESIGTLEIAGSKCDALPGWTPIPLTGLAGLASVATIGSLELRFLFDFQSLAGLPADATVTSLELRNLPLLSDADAQDFATAVQAQSPWICGLGGDDFCLTLREGAPCPQ